MAKKNFFEYNTIQSFNFNSISRKPRNLIFWNTIQYYLTKTIQYNAIFSTIFFFQKTIQYNAIFLTNFFFENNTIQLNIFDKLFRQFFFPKQYNTIFLTNFFDNYLKNNTIQCNSAYR